MKIGDKVRFLNAVGGGIVAGFQDRNIVIVTDEDGFDIPALINEVVVVGETTALNLPKRENNVAATAQPRQVVVTDEETDPADLPITFRPKPVERSEGERLNVCLAFVPIEPKEISTTAFEAYLVNDTNYYLHFAYMSMQGSAWHLRHEGVAEPNMKVFLEEFEWTDLGELERVAVQCWAVKRDKPFRKKPVYDVEVRIDTTKFYKLHTFRANDFFDEPAYLIDIVSNDRASQTVFTDAAALQEAMNEKKQTERPSVQPARKSVRPTNEPLVTDLHAAEILDNTRGMQPADILRYQLDTFCRTMNENLKYKGKKLIFIHGKGEGVLRNAIITELKRKYPRCTFQDASFQEYGFGATQVTIH